jgi:hypothetical protein
MKSNTLTYLGVASFFVTDAPAYLPLYQKLRLNLIDPIS